MSELALELSGLRKRFGSVVALDGADFQVRAGEVHALLGQNGSGKSTLVKALAGYHRLDDFQAARVWGADVQLPPRAPHELGLAVIHQELALIDSMTVTENLGVSSAYQTSTLAPVRWKAERARAAELLGEFGVDIDPDALVASLSPADRAAVGVVRAVRELRLHGTQQILVLDEPTAYMPDREARRIMDLMRRMADGGCGVVFISHRLGEVMGVCDRATILRDGRTVGTVGIAETTPRELIKLMLGRDIGEFYPDKIEPPAGAGALLEASELSGESVEGINLQLKAGEIVGITGLVGQGQEELPYLLAAAKPARAGTVTLAEGRVSTRLRDRLSGGVILVPANRAREGLWPSASAAENISLPHLHDHIRRGMLSHRRERNRAAELMDRFGVQPVAPDLAASGFSGGNAQKVVLAKWLQSDPKVLVLDEPTQGVDAGAKREILRLIRDTVAAGAGAILCSSDYEEVANVCHRVLVLSEGRVSAELDGEDVTEQNILEACHAA